MLAPLLIPALLAAPVGPTVTVTREAMGVRFEVTLVGVSEARALALAEPCFDEVDRLEASLGMWSADSALRRLNADPELAARPVDAELGRALEEALAFCARSEGAFDPTIGAVLETLGYYAEERGELPEGDALDALRARLGCGKVCVTWLPDGRAAVTRAVPGIVLDLSGVTKGWAVDRVVERLRAAGVETALVAAGPSALLGFGPGPDGQGWEVEVPLGEEEPARWLLLDQAIATSGQRSFTVQVGDERQSHIVDPRRALPVEHDTWTTVVRARTCTEADLTSTALLVLGADEGARWLRDVGARPEELRAVAVCGAEGQRSVRALVAHR